MSAILFSDSLDDVILRKWRKAGVDAIGKLRVEIFEWVDRLGEKQNNEGKSQLLYPFDRGKLARPAERPRNHYVYRNEIE